MVPSKVMASDKVINILREQSCLLLLTTFALPVSLLAATDFFFVACMIVARAFVALWKLNPSS